MMAQPARGEVWLVDFGFVGKTRPALVVNIKFGARDRSLITVVPHTTSLRGSPFEIAAPAAFLKQGAFLVQGITTFPAIRASRRLGSLSPEAFSKVFNGLLQWLGAMNPGNQSLIT